MAYLAMYGSDKPTRLAFSGRPRPVWQMAVSAGIDGWFAPLRHGLRHGWMVARMPIRNAIEIAHLREREALVAAWDTTQSSIVRDRRWRWRGVHRVCPVENIGCWIRDS